MKRKDFIKKSAHALAISSFTTWDLFASNNYSDEKNYYFRKSTQSDSGGYYILSYIKMNNQLKKGDVFKFSLYFSKIDRIPSNNDDETLIYKVESDYELLEDFVLSKEINVHQIGNTSTYVAPGAEIYDDLASYLPKIDKFILNERVIRREQKYTLGDVIYDRFQIEEMILYFKDKKVTEFLNEEKIIESDCFLTSACVFNLGLPDDCKELSTLRDFRDNYMSDSIEGQLMIKNYYTIGPNIVNYIQKQEHRDKMYHFIYNYLVLPSVEMIENDENEKAMQYYAAFTNLLKQKCNV